MMDIFVSCTYFSNDPNVTPPKAMGSHITEDTLSLGFKRQKSSYAKKILRFLGILGILSTLGTAFARVISMLPAPFSGQPASNILNMNKSRKKSDVVSQRQIFSMGLLKNLRKIYACLQK
jgi:hypothetical protein